MNAMNPELATLTAQGISIGDQKEQQNNLYPDCLSKHILSIFQGLKIAYNSKNAIEMGRVFSDSYVGSFYSLKNKVALVNFFQETFRSLPTGVSLDLTINIYQVLEDSAEAFRAIADFSSRLKLLMMPLQLFDSERVYIELHSEMPHGIWKITKIDTIKD
ncbi:hypothetical protein PCC6912_40710 [Chlorogloeopsis fritschii PCC 6912]|uniref:SnoaL-like domain-containing protein n=2 Tax=Chlorogloeopsis fritschii TaxID=1124 RepID=A0A433N6J7_CHLFR|nr:hypothetical protein [Chlorogloeopsis fritschii]RUR77112.1 hypothetical protein PCC6912_40710 [Chlorogloeopsis fritschii PCC 6912]